MLDVIIWFVGIFIVGWLLMLVLGGVSELFTRDIKPVKPRNEKDL